jgi:hypothetical protein
MPQNRGFASCSVSETTISHLSILRIIEIGEDDGVWVSVVRVGEGEELRDALVVWDSWQRVWRVVDICL